MQNPLTALLGGQVDCAFVDIAPLRPHGLTGKLKVLAVTGPRRSATFPQAPTLFQKWRKMTQAGNIHVE